MDTRERILELINNKFSSRAEFERAAGFKPQTVNDWDRGKSESFYKRILDVANALGTTSNYLLCETDEPSTLNTKKSVATKGGQPILTEAQKKKIELQKIVAKIPDDKLDSVKAILQAAIDAVK